MTGLPRTQEGGFQHLTSDCVNEEQLWDDTLFMTVLFLYRAGLALDRAAWREEARYQFLLHIKYLHCHQNGLWYHGWCSLGRHHFGEAFGARGNSWFTAVSRTVMRGRASVGRPVKIRVTKRGLATLFISA